MKKVFLRPGLISLVAFMILVSSCSKAKKQSETPLPYYNSADFTPEWITEDQPEYHRIHTIDNFRFQNQDGAWVTNEKLEGKIHVADFFFTICPSICPKMTSNLIRVQEAFPNDPDIQLVSYTVMPWVDSVATLKEYAEIKGIKSEQWNLLTGDKEAIYKLARNSYFAEKEIGLDKDSEEFLHTENFILVDGKGRIRGVYNGTLPLEMMRLIADIKTLKALG